MNRIISILVGIAILSGVIFMPISIQAEEANTTSVQELIQIIKQKIEELKTQIEALTVQLESLRETKGEIKETVKEIKSTLKIARQLDWGTSGEDVTLLQEVLATDPEIYPEGLVTGYFGPLTYKAVKRFQKEMGVEQVGRVGPKTMSKINELLEQGAGSSGKVPPGLLIAPGIRKKIGEDTTAPVISKLAAKGITATSARITWFTNELADSKVWYYDKGTSLVITESTPMESSSKMVFNHNIELSDLIPNTAYSYLVSSTDSTLNTTTSSIEGFNTLSE